MRSCIYWVHCTIIGHNIHLPGSYPAGAGNILIGNDSKITAAGYGSNVVVGKGAFTRAYGTAIGAGAHNDAGGPPAGSVAIGNAANTTGAYAFAGGAGVAAATTSVAIGGYHGSYGTTAAAGTGSVAIGSGARTHSGANTSIAIGYGANTNDTDADNAIAIGNGAKALHTGAIVIGRSAYANGNAQKSVVIGDDAESTNAISIAIGQSAKCAGVRQIAIGYHTDVLSGHHESFAIGKFVQQGTNDSGEIGWWSNASTRGGGVKIDGQSGTVAITLQNNNSPHGDGGSSAGDEGPSQLMREAYAVRRNGTRLFIDTNIAGTIHTTSLSQDSPSFTGLATFERIALSQNSFTTISTDITLTEAHNGATLLCANSSAIDITLPSREHGFTTTFIQKGNGLVRFVAGSGVGVNSFAGANALAGFAAQASVLYDSPSSVFLGGQLG